MSNSIDSVVKFRHLYSYFWLQHTKWMEATSLITSFDASAILYQIIFTDKLSLSFYLSSDIKSINRPPFSLYSSVQTEDIICIQSDFFLVYYSVQTERKLRF